MSWKSINPSTGQVFKEYSLMDSSEVEKKLAMAQSAFLSWSQRDLKDRENLISQLAQILESKKQDYASLINLEMGKIHSEAVAEVEKCASMCRYYLESGKKHLTPVNIPTEYKSSAVHFEPLGVILGIMPWNFPFWQVLRFAVPTILAGNSVLLKHAPNVTGCSLALEDLFCESGAPQGLFQSLLVEVDLVPPILADDRVQGVSLTGSTRAGKAVAAVAGAHLKRCVLELGGSDAYVVLDDADLEKASIACVRSRMINSGQSCVAAKRWIVTQNLRKDFEERVSLEIKKYRLSSEATDSSYLLGPIAREDLRAVLHEQVLRSQKQGVRVVEGGVIPQGPGYFYPPTLLVEVRPGTVAFEEELFGPVASLITAESEEQALEWANQSSYGLGAAIFSRDEGRALSLAQHFLQAGNCFVNDFVRSDPRLPFGGIKQSGVGRELSFFGLHEFTNVKTVVQV